MNTYTTHRIAPTPNLGSKRFKIGILGGSFNPPHRGHLHISKVALQRLNLDRVIWLVTPCNPHKNPTDYASLASRLQLCQKIVKDYSHSSKIIVSALERNNSRFHSYFTLSKIKRLHANDELFWLMGADNLHSFSRWYRWRDIADMCSVVVLDRANNLRCWRSAKLCNSGQEVRILYHKKVNISSTAIRKKRR